MSVSWDDSGILPEVDSGPQHYFSCCDVREFSPTHVPIMCATTYNRAHTMLCHPNQGLVLQILYASVSLFPLYIFLPQGIVTVMKPESYT